MRSARGWAVVGGCAAVVLILGGAAWAVTPTAATTYAACLKNGVLSNVAIGSTPTAKCPAGADLITWNQQGPTGPTGPAGPTGPTGPTGLAGPTGPPGTGLSSLDQLAGLPCRGVNGKTATVRLDYGSGIEAPVSIVCETHLVANPGPVTVTATSGSLRFQLVGPYDLPTGWSLHGTVDHQGRLAPTGSTTIQVHATFGGTVITGSADVDLTLRATGGTIDPATGQVDVVAEAYGQVTLDLSTIVGTYQGTCAVGTEAAPIDVPFSTAGPGVAYSQDDGTLTLAASVDVPQLTDCSAPLLGVPEVDSQILGLLAGPGTLTFAGVVDPVLLAP